MKRPLAFMIDIKRFYKLLLAYKDLRYRNFCQWNATALSIKICTEMHFRCLFSLNEKIIVMCHLMIHIKCVTVICFNEDWSSVKRPFRNNEPPNMVCHFFRFFTFSCRYVIFAKNFMEKLSFFNINFWNSF